MLLIFADKPIFPKDSENRVFKVEEGGSIIINLTATANPNNIEYKWTNPDKITIPTIDEAMSNARFVANGGILNVTNAERSDWGQYKVKAKNSEGKEVVKFHIDVQYEPK